MFGVYLYLLQSSLVVYTVLLNPSQGHVPQLSANMCRENERLGILTHPLPRQLFSSRGHLLMIDVTFSTAVKSKVHLH